jgi:ribosomal protein L37AE/L43A
MSKAPYKPQCKSCGDDYDINRWKLGIAFCMSCGDELAHKVVRTIVPMHKSNYVACFNMEDLKGINNKGGLVK